MPSRSIFFLSLMPFILLPHPAPAAIIHIPADQLSIQAGIDAALEGDTVLVWPGEWIERIDFCGKDITVGSLFLTTGDTTCIAATVIDGDDLGGVVTCVNGETAAALLCGFTLTNGRGLGSESAYAAGGITCRGSSPRLSALIVSGNESIGDFGCGGGIVCSEQAAPLITGVILTGNTAPYGGGIACLNAQPLLQQVAIDSNSASSGGGLYCTGFPSPCLEDVVIRGNHSTGDTGGGITCCDDATPVLTRVLIEGNLSEWNGGGICCLNGGSPLLNEVQLLDNSAGHAGGGIYCEQTTLAAYDTQIRGNSAFFGGGIYCRDDSHLWIVRACLTGNSVNVDGGGIYCDAAALELMQLTVCNNHAPWDGGAIYFREDSRLNIVNCIFWGNSADQLYCPEFGSPNQVVISCSDLEGGEEGIETSGNCTVEWLEHNIDSDPLFCAADEGDYRLQLDSPCRTDTCGFMGYTGETCEGEAVPPVGVTGRSPSPRTIELAQNHPNPFNPTTTIAFTLPRPQHIRLAVYNLRGQLVARLAEGVYAAGTHRVVFSTGVGATGRSSLSSGVYLYRLTSESGAVSRKMVLVR